MPAKLPGVVTVAPCCLGAGLLDDAAEHCGYGRARGYQIVEIREGKAS